MKNERLRNHPRAASKIEAGVKRCDSQDVTPECFNRGSSPDFAWIPAKSMRNDGFAGELELEGHTPISCSAGERKVMNQLVESFS
jgi:hypothetical protein